MTKDSGEVFKSWSFTCPRHEGCRGRCGAEASASALERWGGTPLCYICFCLSRRYHYLSTVPTNSPFQPKVQVTLYM